jgi:hypothetical protein
MLNSIIIKRCLILTALLFTFTFVATNCADASEWRKLNTTIDEKHIDDYAHIAFAVGAAHITNKLLEDKIDNKAYRTLISMAVPVLLGAAKECTDKHFDSSDIIDYGVGSVMFAFTLKF